MMSGSTRDPSVDIIKGFACILMICAHLPALQITEIFPRVFIHLCGIATALFFASAGVTATFQTSKYKISSLTLYFFLIFIFGTSWNILLRPSLLAFQVIEIFQVIALGSIFVCVLERGGKKASQSVLLISAISISLLKFLADIFIPEFDGLGILLPSNDYIPHEQVISIDDRVWPGFALFPWLFVFPLGVFCYRASKQTNFLGLIGSVIVLMISSYMGSVPIEKWDMTIAYLSQLYIYIFLAFWFMKEDINNNIITRLFEWMGKNIIIFFFTHPLAIFFGLFVWQVANIYLAWSMAILAGIFLTYIFSSLKPANIFKLKSSWIITAIILLASPFMSDLTHNQSFAMAAQIIALLVGIIFAVNVSHLSALVKSELNK